ncbi:MAG: hypothetical protein ACYTHJ_07805 [Planctomycetota bacterium]
MKFLIEFEGVLSDVGRMTYTAHSLAAESVGWSRLDQASFWRMLRTKGLDAPFLPGAKPMKLKNYQEAYIEALKSPKALSKISLVNDLGESIRKMERVGACSVVSLASEVETGNRLLGACQLPGVEFDVTPLDAEILARTEQLNSMVGSERRGVLVASTDTLLRTASGTDLFAVGVSFGTCSVKRLQQAGAALTFRHLDEFADCVASGGKELLEAGMLPFSVE